MHKTYPLKGARGGGLQGGASCGAGWRGGLQGGANCGAMHGAMRIIFFVATNCSGDSSGSKLHDSATNCVSTKHYLVACGAMFQDHSL